MSLAFLAARAISSLSTWGLKKIFHRPAANFPGKAALYLDPRLIADLKPKLEKGSVVVVGTNGKTTVTNLLADVLEQAGWSVVCNRTGANLDSGVATALLHAQPSDWGVFEADELWLAKILPGLQADYVLLLNLFQDQLDRVGEIERIQKSIIGALETSPRTVLIYNADDPLCAMIARKAKNSSIAFGTTDAMGLSKTSAPGMFLCQKCSAPLNYTFCQYEQLGSYSCPACDFCRPPLDFAIEAIQLGTKELSFRLNKIVPDACGKDATAGKAGAFSIRAFVSGAYMVYNLAAVGVAASMLGCSNETLQKAVDAFDPQNGRLQSYEVGGRFVLLNLAKNPTGFNQNIEIVLQGTGPKAVAFFVNDKEGDGRDVSWLWDVDFEALAKQHNIEVYAGGMRRNEVQVRLKYAGLSAQLIDSVSDLFAHTGRGPSNAHIYLIANYTALPLVHADMERLKDRPTLTDEQALGAQALGAKTNEEKPEPSAILKGQTSETLSHFQPIVIAHLLPDLLNLYGDGGNVSVLAHRLRARGIPVEIKYVYHGDCIDLASVDLVFFGGGPDREQQLALCDLMAMRDDLHAYVNRGGVLFATGGGYPLLGNTCLLGGEIVKGLGIVDMDAECPPALPGRLVGDIALRSPLASLPVIGYENHAGSMRLKREDDALGEVIASTGSGKDSVKQAGVCWQNVIGTYLHGAMLAKNPEVADALLLRALTYHAARCKSGAFTLSALDDTIEIAANNYVSKKLGIAL